MNVEISNAPAGRSDRIARRVSPWQLGLAILVFVLPFASVSCSTPKGYGSAGGGITARYSGFTLAFGGNPTIEAAGGAPAPGPLTPEDAIAGQIAITIGLALTVAAFALSIARPGRLEARIAFPAGAVVALVVGVAAFDQWLTTKITGRLEMIGVSPQVGFPPEEYVRTDVGFLVAILVLTLTALLNGLALLRRRRLRT